MAPSGSAWRPVTTGEQVPLALADALGVPLDGAAADRRRPRANHHLPGASTPAAAGRQLRARRRRCRRTDRRAPRPLPGRDGPRHQPRGAGRPRRGAGDRRTPGDRARGNPGRPRARVPGIAAVRRARPSRPARRRLRRARPSRRRLDQPGPRRDPAGPRARRGPGRVDVAGRDLRPAGATGSPCSPRVARTAEARQQTLRATVDWSYALLTEHEQRVFNRLAVFQGGWTLVCGRGRRQRRLHVDAQPCSTPSVGWSSDPCSPSTGRPPPGIGCWRHCVSTPPSSWLRHGEDDVRATRHADYFRDLAEDAEMALAWPRAARDLRAAARRTTQHQGRTGLVEPARRRHGRRRWDGRRARTVLAPRTPPRGSRTVLARLLATERTGRPAARARALAGRLPGRTSPRMPGAPQSVAARRPPQESLGDLRGDRGPSRAALSRVLLAVEGVTGANLEQPQAASARPTSSSRVTATMGSGA